MSVSVLCVQCIIIAVQSSHVLPLCASVTALILIGKLQVLALVAPPSTLYIRLNYSTCTPEDFCAAIKMFVQVNFKFSIMLSIKLLSNFRVNLDLATIFII